MTQVQSNHVPHLKEQHYSYTIRYGDHDAMSMPAAVEGDLPVKILAAAARLPLLRARRLACNGGQTYLVKFTLIMVASGGARQDDRKTLTTARPMSLDLPHAVFRNIASINTNNDPHNHGWYCSPCTFPSNEVMYSTPRV